MQTENVMSITPICLFVNVCKFVLCIGLLNCPIKETLYLYLILLFSNLDKMGPKVKEGRKLKLLTGNIQL